MSLFNELKRRNIFRVAAAYIIVGWLLLQISDVLVPALHLPGWFHSGVAFLLILGFPIAMILAWAFELTPDGIKREHEVDRSASITPGTGRKLDYTIISLLAVALVYFVWESRFQADDVVPVDSAGQAEIAADTDDANAPPAEEPVRSISKRSIAVLPFDNRSNREEDQFFTDGIHDDLLTTIAKIGSMKVISRTSVMEYKNTIKKIPVIAKELGVANILEGGIQRSGNQVRINVQLIDAVTDEHLWAEIYDRELTAENLFAIQSEISKAIADALHATLSAEEVQRIDTMPTSSLVAFDAYLRGRQLMASRDAEQLKLAIEQFNKAVELDPDFALAWVGVADSNRLYPNYGGVKSEDFFAIREDAINNALAIDDQLGEAYASLGSLHADKNQSELAETAFQRAIALSPNYATAWQWYSQLVNRDLLRAKKSIELLKKAAELDPRSSIIGLNLAGQYRYRGLYSLAERQYLEVLDRDPAFMLGHRTLAGFYQYVMSRSDLAWVHTQKMMVLAPGDLGTLFLQVQILLHVGLITAAEDIYNQMRVLDADNRRVAIAGIMIKLSRNESAAARKAIDLFMDSAVNDLTYIEHTAHLELTLGETYRARELFLNADPSWLDPDNWPGINKLTNYGCTLAWVFIHTGDMELGQELLHKTTRFFEETFAIFSEHVDYSRPETCYLTAGDTEKALQSIETQVAHNHLADWELDHRLPLYDLIRNEPRYQAALEERRRIIAVQREAIKKLNLDTELSR